MNDGSCFRVHRILDISVVGLAGSAGRSGFAKQGRVATQEARVPTRIAYPGLAYQRIHCDTGGIPRAALQAPNAGGKHQSSLPLFVIQVALDCFR